MNLARYPPPHILTIFCLEKKDIVCSVVITSASHRVDISGLVKGSNVLVESYWMKSQVLM